MSRRRKARPHRNKRSDRRRKRTCTTGKRGWRHQGEADAFLRQHPNPRLVVYRCEECAEWHLGGAVPRSVRLRRVAEGKPPWPEPELTKPTPPPQRKDPPVGLLSRSKEKPTPTPDELVELLAELDAGDIRELAAFKEAAEGLTKARATADALTGDIEDEGRYSEATDAMKFLDDAVKDAEAARKKTKKVFDNAGKFVQSSFTELKNSAKAARESLEQRALAFERKREKEERERREEEEAAARKAEAEAKAEGNEEEARHQREEVDRAMAPRAQVTGARGDTGAKASPTSELKYEITDEALLPDEYVKREPNRAKILEAVRQGIAIPGVRPYREKKVRVR